MRRSDDASDPARGATTDPPAWRPLLAGEERERALRVVEAIAAQVADVPAGERRDASLAGGLSGIAVLHAMTALRGRSEHGDERARRSLEAAIDLVATEPMGISLYGGFPGVAWATEVVDGLLDHAADDRNEGIDEVLARALARGNWADAPYDLITGVTGLGVYFLDRLPRPAAADALGRVVDLLGERAMQDDDGVFWWTSLNLVPPHQRERYPSGGVDLGVAHGVAAVIALLARACGQGVAADTARPLLDGAVRWLLARALPTDEGPTIPYFLAPGLQPMRARSAWCYGDPGVAAALLIAARATGERGWEREATALARRAADRPLAETGVTDAGFCHGAAGLAHLFNRMQQSTGDALLAEAASRWLERTLDACGAASTASLWSPGGAIPPSQPWNGHGVLEGAAGVALVLLAAATELEPVWDRMFLVSGPEAAPAQER